jgi:flagellar brake protein
MDMTPLPDRPENEQYQLYSRAEIIALLRELAANHTLVTIYYDGTAQFVLTTILAVNPEFEELVLDTSANPRDTEALIRSGELTVVGLLDHVKVQFSATHVERFMFEGGDALRIRLPDSMLRLQRRNFYRIATPVVRPLEVVIPENNKRPRTTVRVVDLSCGGVGVVYQTQLALELGMMIDGCRLDLPEIGSITCTLEVRFLMHTAGPGGTQRTRCGFQFVQLPPGTVTLLQRYINKLERERRSKT